MVMDRSRPPAGWLLILGFCAFFFFFGLNYFGLIGADEPRYAQIAREMLARRQWVTPILGGQPWLEKPVLYYWEAILSYRIFGVSDWAARIPSAVDATLMVFAIYVFLRRFRPGFQLDGALMTASAAAVIGFARAASMDMPLAAAFTIALLAWYAWQESGSRTYLALFYLFLALATLAKGPVAPLLAALVIIIYAAAVRHYRIIWRTLWLPGVVLFCVVALPWYVAVQLRNTQFFRFFVLEHNLARFGTGIFHHERPFWYFLPVALLGLAPWTVFVIAALVETIRSWWRESHTSLQSEDRLNLFLVLWLVTPVVFFSFSQSKLAGYLLPAIPAGMLLLAEYVRRHVVAQERPSLMLIIPHSIVAVLPMIPALMINDILRQHRFPWGTAALISIILAAVLAIGMIFTLSSSLGLSMLRFVTLVSVVLALTAVLKIGGATLDATLSARPLAADIARIEAGMLPTAVFHIPRETEYGLAFYRNQVIFNYDQHQIPARDHLLIVPDNLQWEITQVLADRRVSFLGNFAPQHLQYYWVSAAGMKGMQGMQH